MKTLTILFIVTSQAFMGQTQEATGVWLEELTTPYYAFIDAGYDVDIVSVRGGDIPIDPRSLADTEAYPESVKRFQTDKNASALVKKTPSIEGLETSQYAAIFIPGGHGTMWDMPENKTLANIISSTLADDRVVAAVCHGPAALVNVTDEHGASVVKGKRVAAFTNSEEEAVGLTDSMPFLLETRLRALGAEVITADDFTAHAMGDGNLITGQNPASSEAVATLAMQAITDRK